MSDHNPILMDFCRQMGRVERRRGYIDSKRCGSMTVKDVRISSNSLGLKVGILW